MQTFYHTSERQTRGLLEQSEELNVVLKIWHEQTSGTIHQPVAITHPIKLFESSPTLVFTLQSVKTVGKNLGCSCWLLWKRLYGFVFLIAISAIKSEFVICNYLLPVLLQAKHLIKVTHEKLQPLRACSLWRAQHVPCFQLWVLLQIFFFKSSHLPTIKDISSILFCMPVRWSMQNQKGKKTRLFLTLKG